MLYKPFKERLWDTWIVSENSKYYLYYIRVSENGSRWDGISLAVSNDLIHWEEHGTVLIKDDDAIWLGTGMVQKIGSKYIMNYSQEKPAGEQKIYFAESNDLINWEKVNDLVLEPDGKIYLKENSGISDNYPRWDSLGVVNALDSNKKAPYYAFLTSDSATFDLPGKRGVLGCCKSNDGLHWEHLKAATDKFDIVPAFEVPEHIEFNGNHYVTFCTSSKLGYRFDKYAKHLSGGTYYVYSENLLGPYDFPETDPMLVGSRDVDNVTMGSVGRVFQIKDKVIFYHIWGDQTADGWVGTVKELVEVSKGHLQLMFWKNNELLKNIKVSYGLKDLTFKDTKKIGDLYPVTWENDLNQIVFKNIGSSGIIMSDQIPNVKTEHIYNDGRFIELSLNIVEGLGAGIVFKTKSNENICVFFNKRDESVDFAKVTNGFCSNLVLQGIMSSRNFEVSKETLNIKVLVRKYFIEVYINDIYISGLRLEEQFNSEFIGFYAEDSSGKIKNFKIYQMK